MVRLANMYADGRGVPENGGEAVRWYRLAAEQPEVTLATLAQYTLGVMYANGRGVLQDNVCTAPGFLDTNLGYAAWRSSYSLAGLERRTIRELLEAPVLVVAFDELGNGGAHVGEASKDPAVDRFAP